MLNFTKKLVLMGLVITVAGCSSWAPLFRSEKPVNGPKTAEPTFASSEESVVLFSQPLVSEPPIPEPTLLQ
jgi:hypothetical protein